MFGANKLVINDGVTICNNNKGGVSLENHVLSGFCQPVFQMNGGTIRGNSAANGGGVYVGTGSAFIMNRGNISGNSATNGGGVYVSSSLPPFYSTVFTQKGGSISSNTPSQNQVYYQP